MGSVSLSQSYGTMYQVNATASWTTGPTVTVKISYNSNGDGWRIRGRNPDTTEYLVCSGGTWTGTFDAENGKDYVFQVYFGVQGSYSDGQVFTVNFDNNGGSSGGGTSGGGSSGGGSSSSTGPFTLYINEGVGTELQVMRSWPPERTCHTPLETGEPIYCDGEDTFYFLVEVLDGYELDTYDYYGVDAPLYIENFSYYLTDENNPDIIYFQLENYGNASVTSSATPNQYKLTISESAGSTLTVTRISTNHKSASIGTISNGSPIYHDDVLQITYNIDTGYSSDVKIGNTTISSGDTYIVTGNTAITANTSVKSYELTLNPDTGVTITVNRISSPLKDATNKTWTTYEEEETYSDIYYGDVLTITAESNAEYKINLQQINGSSFVSDATHTVADNVYIVAITELSGVVHIFNGASFDNYIIQIFNGSTWYQYIPYVFDGANWSVCS